MALTIKQIENAKPKAKEYKMLDIARDPCAQSLRPGRLPCQD